MRKIDRFNNRPSQARVYSVGLSELPRIRDGVGRPGTLVPLAWLPTSRSTLDLVSDGWALLAAGASWEAVDRVPVHQVSADWLAPGATRRVLKRRQP